MENIKKSKLFQKLQDISTPYAISLLTQAYNNAWAPPPKLTVSQWADQFRMLSPEDSAEPGKWLTSRAEYQRGIMDAVTEPGIHTIVLMTSAQIGKTAILTNIIGYYIDNDPAPILVVQPTGQMAEAFSTDRLAPMFRDTKKLTNKVSDEKSRTKSNTLLHKMFVGGHITLVGANAPSGLASRPIRIVLADEIDRYPPSAGTEGDPFSLAVKRTTTFHNRKIFACSTPTIKDASRIEQLFLSGDQRFFHVPCQYCEKTQTLKWSNVKWFNDDPKTARYECEHCKKLLTDGERWLSIKQGHWKATQPKNGTASFHLNEIYSPFVPLHKMVEDFLEKRKYPETLRTFINTSLGETWEDKGEEFVDPTHIAARRENYGAEVPTPVKCLTAGIDIQQDRIECEVVGWADDEETYGIKYHIIPGDTTRPETWQKLDEFLQRDFIKANGVRLTIEAACVDTGFRSTIAYDFCKHRQNRRIWPIKGDNGQTRKPLWPKMPTRNKKTPLLYIIGVTDGKDTLFSRLQIEKPGAGFAHFPKEYDLEYFNQLLSEHAVIKMNKGVKYRTYVLKRDRRNEALDCRIYAMAAYQGLVTEGLRINTRTLLNTSANSTTIKRPSRSEINPFTGRARFLQ